MTKNRVITAIDLGTDKCVTLIATVGEDKKPRVVGVSAVPAKGMKKSNIVDLEQVLSSMTESLDGAERMAGFEVNSAYLSVSGVQVNSRNSKGVVAVASADHEITELDVERVIEAARAISLSADEQIMHVIPCSFRVDSQDGIKDPVGMTGIRLEVEVHIITGKTTVLRNLEKCANDLGITIDGFVFAGLAAAEVALTETEKELGVMVVDFGAGSTSVCAYVDGNLEYSGSLVFPSGLPVGALLVTKDIAGGCRLSIESAEKIKLALTDEDLMSIVPLPGESKEDLNKRRRKADILELDKIGVMDSQEKLSKHTLVEGIMLPRMKEICQLLLKVINEKDLGDKIVSGIVLTGGGAQTVRMVEVIKRMLDLPVRIGYPTKIEGMVSDISKPSYATSIGLLIYGLNQGGGKVVSNRSSIGDAFKAIKWQDFTKKISGFFKSLMP